MTAQQVTNPQVTMRLTYGEFVLFVANHSGHFTSEAGKRIAGELADGGQYGYATRRKITCHRHGDGCTAAYDNGDGFYYVTTDAYATEDQAWADTLSTPPLDPATGQTSWFMYATAAVKGSSQAEADNRAHRYGVDQRSGMWW